MKFVMNTLLTLPMIAPLGAAQDEPAPVEPTPAERVSAALEALGSGEYSLTGAVEKIEPEGEDSGMGMNARVVIAGGPGGGAGGGDFTGAFSVWRTAQQEMVITSGTALPGVGIYDDGDRRISRVTAEESAPSASSLATDVLGLLDVRRLAKSVSKADELQVSHDEATGRLTVSGPLSKRLIRGGGGMMSFMEPQVLKIGGMFVLDGNGALESMTFSVLRSDPMARMRRDAMAGGFEGGGGGSRVITRGGGPPEASTDPGATWVYSLKRVAAPSKRSRAFHGEIAGILSTEEI